MSLPQKKLIPSILVSLVIGAIAGPPLWWSSSSPPVIDTAAVENNHGPANIGQAKHMTSSALVALEAILPEVAQQIEQDLTIPQPNPEGGNFPAILELTVPDPKPANWAEMQKAPLRIGQLKAIADPFYTRLNAVAPSWLRDQRLANGTDHLGSIFPWSPDTADDKNTAVANIGQLKAVFSLDFTSTDDGSDNIPDLVVIANGNNQGESPAPLDEDSNDPSEIVGGIGDLDPSATGDTSQSEGSGGGGAADDAAQGAGTNPESPEFIPPPEPFLRFSTKHSQTTSFEFENETTTTYRNHYRDRTSIIDVEGSLSTARLLSLHEDFRYPDFESEKRSTSAFPLRNFKWLRTFEFGFGDDDREQFAFGYIRSSSAYESFLRFGYDFYETDLTSSIFRLENDWNVAVDTEYQFIQLHLKAESPAVGFGFESLDHPEDEIPTDAYTVVEKDTETVTLTIKKGEKFSESHEVTAPPLVDGEFHVKFLLPVKVEVPKLDANGAEVSGELVAANELRVSKMEQSLTVEKNAGQITKEELDIDKDIDRFYIRIPGGAALANGKEVSVKLKTAENAKAKYNDDETEIKLIIENGDLVSKSLMLTSDDPDDDFAGDIEVGADDQKDDRTHIVQLGGKLVLSKLKIGDDEHDLNLEKSVKKKKKVTVNFVILNDGNVNVQETKDRITRDLEVATERFTQVGVELVKGVENEVPVPDDLELTEGKLYYSSEVIDRRIVLTDDIKKIIKDSATVGKTDDIHIIYVPYTVASGGMFGGVDFGVALAKFAVVADDAGFSENIIMAPGAQPLVLAHEVGHILTQGEHYSFKNVLDIIENSPEPLSEEEVARLTNQVRTNLMNDGVSDSQRIGDTKRLLEEQENKILVSPHAKAP